MVAQALILSSMSAFSAVPAPFRVLLGLKSEYRQRLASSCRAVAGPSAPLSPRARERVPTLVLRETCGGGGGRRERLRDHLHADGGIAVLVVRLMTVLVIISDVVRAPPSRRRERARRERGLHDALTTNMVGGDGVLGSLLADATGALLGV